MRRVLSVISLLLICQMAFAGGMYIPPDVAKDPDIMWTVRGCPASQTIIDRLGAYGVSSSNILCADVAGSNANLSGRSATVSAGTLAVQGAGGNTVATLTGSGIALSPGTLMAAGVRNVSASLNGSSGSALSGNLGVSGIGGANAILAGSYGQMSAGTLGVAGQRNVGMTFSSASAAVSSGTLSVLGGGGGGTPASYVGAGPYANAFESDSTVSMPTVVINSGDLLILFAVGSGVYENGHTWTALIDNTSIGGISVFYRYAVGDEQNQIGPITDYSYYDGQYNYNTTAKVFAFRNTPTSSPFSTHGETSAYNIASSSLWTGRALSNVETGSLIAFFCYTPGSYHGTAVGGGVDTLVTHASGGGYDLGYKTNQSGSIAAPTMTMSGSAGGFDTTLVIKGK